MMGLWQIFSIVNLVMVVVAVYRLINLKSDSVTKLLWALLVIFVPFAGSILFFVWRKRLLNADRCSGGK